jgi:hypothetical protein
MTTSRQEVQAKIERVHAARIEVEAFVAAGGDLKSKDAVPIGRELARSYESLLREFGQEVLDDVNMK